MLTEVNKHIQGQVHCHSMWQKGFELSIPLQEVWGALSHLIRRCVFVCIWGVIILLLQNPGLVWVETFSFCWRAKAHEQTWMKWAQEPNTCSLFTFAQLICFPDRTTDQCPCLFPRGTSPWSLVAAFFKLRTGLLREGARWPKLLAHPAWGRRYRLEHPGFLPLPHLGQKHEIWTLEGNSLHKEGRMARFGDN